MDQTTYAIIKTGGKQYRVAAGQKLKVEKLTGNPGEAIKFDEVCLVSKVGQLQIGTPLVAGAVVSGKILGLVKDRRVITFKKRRRKGFKKKKGHRQQRTEVLIEQISG